MSTNHINPYQLVESISINKFYSLDSTISNAPLSTFSYQLTFKPFNYSLLTNNVDILSSNDNHKGIDITSITEVNDDTTNTQILTNLPLFHVNKNLIKIPRKVEYAIRRYIPKELLYKIHNDIEVAIELCLLFTSLLTPTYFQLKDGSGDGWRSLNSTYLRDFISVDPKAYKHIRTALEYPLDKGPILICDYEKIIGTKNFYYRLGEAFNTKGIVSYQLKTKTAQRVLNEYYSERLLEGNKNPIFQNLIKFYSTITLPTEEQIMREATRLIKMEYRTNKGKLLTRLNKHSKSYFKDASSRSFVEDSLEIFHYLTVNGLMIPHIGDDDSGGRVVDSLTLMPSWIRRMIKIEGNPSIEADYSCLHPNIAIHLYGGEQEYLTHGDVQLATDIDIDMVKREHLSFFNKTQFLMEQSPLYKYYQEFEPRMMENLIQDKYNSPFKYKITSRKMFGLEVEIITDVIVRLNKEGIYVGYVYDALFCHPRQAERLKEVMDQTILKHGVKTTAKLSNGKKHNPYMTRLNDTKFDMSFLNNPNTNTNAKVKRDAPDTSKYMVVSPDDLNFSLNIKEDILGRMANGEQIEFVNAIIKFAEDDLILDKVTKANDWINPQLKFITQTFINNKDPMFNSA